MEGGGGEGALTSTLNSKKEEIHTLIHFLNLKRLKKFPLTLIL